MSAGRPSHCFHLDSQENPLITLKKILLTQYIGAIMTAFIAAQGVLGTISLVTNAATWRLLASHERTRSVFGMSEAPPRFDWTGLIVGMVSVALHFAVAYLLVRWLYLDKTNPTTEGEPSSS